MSSTDSITRIIQFYFHDRRGFDIKAIIANVHRKFDDANNSDRHKLNETFALLLKNINDARISYNSICLDITTLLVKLNIDIDEYRNNLIKPKQQS